LPKRAIQRRQGLEQLGSRRSGHEMPKER
jgi:hypothetical protein